MKLNRDVFTAAVTRPGVTSFAASSLAEADVGVGFRRRTNHLCCIFFRAALQLLLFRERGAAASRLIQRRRAVMLNKNLQGNLLEQLDKLLRPPAIIASTRFLLRSRPVPSRA